MPGPFRLALMAWPGGRRALVAATLGAGVAAGQAPLQAWWLALPALSALIAVIASENRWGARLWLGWLAGAGHFTAALFWIVEPFLVEPWKFGWMAPFALVLTAGGMALFWSLAGAVSGLGSGRAGRALAFAFGLALSDLIRGYVFTGFPWALVGQIWVGGPVAQGAAVVGAVGLSLLSAVAASLPAMSMAWRERAALAAVAVLLVAPVWLWGEMRLAAQEPPRDPPIRVRLVQPNATQALKWQAGMWQVFLQRQLSATAAPRPAPLDLIVWPETAVPWLLGDAGPFLEEMALAANGVPVAFGIQRSEGPLYFNSLAVIDGSGGLAQVYDKARLTPFGEYVPLGDLLARFGIRAFAAQAGYGYAFGPGARVLDLGTAGRVLPLICYEAIFPGYLRAAPGRADWLLQITNDGWFGNLAGPWQHLAQVRLRAIEQGLPALRSANTGVSAVIDARGRLLRSLPLNSAGFLDAEVPAALAPTPYSRTGDWPVAAFIVGSLALMTLRRIRITG